ncbi:MAG: C69 family dipeptidase [Candidatus Heimdallarchaeota archaeon]|nr:MAG: C69 family dipeptidase [Candidatus Heimdallarchaeota archaeon]
MCDTFVALGSATHNDNVIFGKNSDRPYNERQPVVYIPKQKHNSNIDLKCTYISIPQVEETNAVLLSKPSWMWGAEMGANEYNVVIGNEAIFDTREPMWPPSLLGMDLVRLALERSSTAAQAVHLMCDLLETYGQGGFCAENDPTLMYHNSFLIADPTEAWVLETVGKWWIGQQIKDGIRNISNRLSIRSEYTISRNGIIDYAIEQGYCDNEAEFDFAKCFTKGTYLEPSRYSREGWGKHLLRSNYGEISPIIMMEILRDHFGGICMHGAFRTTASQVSNISKNKAVHWMTGSPHPCISFFKPFVVPTQKDPSECDIFELREKFNLLENDSLVQELHSLEQELIQNIEQKLQTDNWSIADIQYLTQEALNRELSLISL